MTTAPSQLSDPLEPSITFPASLMENPKVSIVMPVMNGGRYFEIALESALAQTYSNIEIVVVNDGSTDGGETERIALRPCDDRIRYFYQQNRGTGGALNTGISQMTGDVFTWLSHDDIFVPYKTASQVAFHRKLGKPGAILFSDYSLIDADGEVFFTTDFDQKLLMRKPLLPLHRTMINGCTLYVPAPIMKTFYPFDEALRYTQDYDLWIKVSRHFEFFLQKEVLVLYRNHPGQSTHRPGAAEERNSLHIRMLEARTEAERVQLSGSELNFFEESKHFLTQGLNPEAAAYAAEKVSTWPVEQTLVSVVLPLGPAAEVTAAARSVLAQTHERLELLLAGAGPLPPELSALAAQDHRIRHVPAEPGVDPRDLAMEHAYGSYIAFLDPRDRFLPGKVATQLAAMMREGAAVSHTSYLVSGHDAPVSSGTFRGSVYPRIIGGCPVALSTVMIHVSVFHGGFRLESGPAEEALAAIWLARRHDLHGIDEPLSQLDPKHAPAWFNREQIRIRLIALREALARDPAHAGRTAEFRQLAEVSLQLGGS